MNENNISIFAFVTFSRAANTIEYLLSELNLEQQLNFVQVLDRLNGTLVKH